MGGGREGDRPRPEVSQQSARSEQSGWVVGTSVVCARANDRREKANVLGACVRANRGTCAVRCHDVCVIHGANAFRGRTGSRVNSSGTWRAIPGASPSVLVAVAEAEAEAEETVVFVRQRCCTSCRCWS